MNRPIDIVVVGAGMTGLTVAALLAANECFDRVTLTVVDGGRRPAFDPSGDVSLRVSAIAAGSVELLKRLDVWQAIEKQRTCPFRNMVVWDACGDAGGPDSLSFDAAEFAVAELGFIVENELIRHELLRKLHAMEEGARFETPIRSVKPLGNRYRIEYADGGSRLADLVVAGDGAGSFVRKQVDIAVDAWRYRQAAFVTHVQPERSHRHTAWQRFLRSGPIALLPLHDGRVSVVWSTSPEQAGSALTASDDDLSAVLNEASGSVLGRLTPQGPRASFPLKSLHARQYVLPGLALVGDAAHAVHPLAGQGANLGLADAARLVGVIVEAIERGEHPGDLPVLRRYERARRGANTTMLYFLDGLNRLFSSESTALEKLRGRGMRLFNRSGPVRQHAVRVALGIGAQ